MAEDFPGMPNTHFFEKDIIRYEPYVQTIESAMMKVAFEVIEEPETNRTQLARALIFSPEDRARFAESFAMWGLYQDDIRLVVFVGPDDYRPDLIHGDVLRSMIRNGWDYASNMRLEDSEG